MLTFTRERDARAIAATLAELYPVYAFEAQKPYRARRWRIAVHCRATGAWLFWAKG